MNAERRPADAARELRLEGLGLVVVGALLLAALAGAFLLGRWVERRAQPSLAAPGADPLAQLNPRQGDVDASEGVTVFDEVRGTEQELEPRREARQEEASPPSRPASGEAPAAVPAVPAGRHFVQVFAGRSRPSAEQLVAELRTAGYPVRMLSEAEGPGALYKVRVGGYSTEDQARAVAAELKHRGHSGAWVPPPD
jgi:cell division protein FtsN